MQNERRALYNSLRLSWLYEPKLQVEPWKVDDYRAMRLEILFERLKQFDFFLDRVSFLALADHADTPEQLTDDLMADSPSFDAEQQDQVYLLVFELWRRLIPEKPCLSVFCDEFDHQIHFYDRGEPNPEALQDVLANLDVILDENTDEGGDPLEVFQFVSAGCANDIESFLYDFIAEQIDNQNVLFASELLDNFSDYVKDVRWFEFLKARVLSSSDPEAANILIRQLVEEAEAEPDLEFNLEVLAYMVQGGERDVFVKLVMLTSKLLELEEDFQDLLTICADYYRLLDQDHEEQKIQQLLKKRFKNKPEAIIPAKDPQIDELLQIIK